MAKFNRVRVDYMHSKGSRPRVFACAREGEV